ncbi:hypothetical protein BGZ76_011647 [Entomortierella beljakovae]|nr:hypothetical protein BGZ76_011647 [Entomortierella beljakovae]
MDGVDCDWCLLCGLHTAEGEAYCSEECRATDLMSSSASSASSAASSNYFSTSPSATLSNSSTPAITSSSTFNNDNYQMPPFVRKQRTSIPNIYAHCTSNPNPPLPNIFSNGETTVSALSHRLLMQQQQLHQQQQQQKQAISSEKSDLGTNSPASTAYPLFYATLNALRPVSPSSQH